MSIRSYDVKVFKELLEGTNREKLQKKLFRENFELQSKLLKIKK